MQVAKRDGALTVWSSNPEGRAQHHKRVGEVARVGGDAVLAPAEHGMKAGRPVDGRENGSWLAFLAGAPGSRKSPQHVRWSRLPPRIARLRTCAEALASRASETTGHSAHAARCDAASLMRTRALSRSPPA